VRSSPRAAAPVQARARSTTPRTTATGASPRPGTTTTSTAARGTRSGRACSRAPATLWGPRSSPRAASISCSSSA